MPCYCTPVDIGGGSTVDVHDLPALAVWFRADAAKALDDGDTDLYGRLETHASQLYDQAELAGVMDAPRVRLPGLAGDTLRQAA